MFGFNLKVPFPGKFFNLCQLCMNYYCKKKMLTFVTFASLGGLRNVQKHLKPFPLTLRKSREGSKRKRRYFMHCTQ